MNQISSNFNQILQFASDYSIRSHNKRAILREYLQSKIVFLIFDQKISKNIFFIGGTSMRLLRNLNRFSEDLDFEYFDVSFEEIQTLMDNIKTTLSQENIVTELYENSTENRFYFELRFPKLLFELDITTDDNEKLVIKFDFENYWKGINRELVLMNKYGFLSNVNTLTIDDLLVQKLFAYLNRKQTMARDIYDIVWLLSLNAKLDHVFMKKNKIDTNLVEHALKKFKDEKASMSGLQRKLMPFLFEPNDVERLKFFSDLVSRL